MDHHQPVHAQEQVSITIEDDEIARPHSYDSDSNSNSEVAVVPNFRQSGILSKNNQSMVERIEEGSSDYVNVKTSFVNGMKYFEKQVEVVAIHRKNYKWSAMDEARVETFRVFASAIASRNDGDPNIRYGWYGGSREEIHDILRFGFRRFENRMSSYGNGIYFSPSDNPIASARRSIADVNGVMHILLCRLILGKQKPIPFGSKIDLPTSTEFDSGVDDISSPTNYTIWEPYMNSLVLPVYIVSFMNSGSLSGAGSSRIGIRYDALKMYLGKYLSSSKMALIMEQMEAFNQRKISRGILLRNLKLIAGENVFREVIDRHGRNMLCASETCRHNGDN